MNTTTRHSSLRNDERSRAVGFPRSFLHVDESEADIDNNQTEIETQNEEPSTHVNKNEDDVEKCAADDVGGPSRGEKVVADAVDKALKDRSTSGLYEGNVVREASFLLNGAKQKYVALRDRLRKDFTPKKAVDDWAKDVEREAYRITDKGMMERLDRYEKEYKAEVHGQSKHELDDDDIPTKPSDSSTVREYALRRFGEDDEPYDPRNQHLVGELLARANREWAVVTMGGKTRYATMGRNAAGNPEHHFSTFAEMSQRYANIPARNIFKRHGDGAKEFTNIFELWCLWPGRRTYDAVGFYPGSEKENCPSNRTAPGNVYNLWSGLAVKPAPGDCNLLLNHLLKRVCRCNEAHYEWLLDWAAHLLQKPWEKPGTAVVLRGAEGAGKTMLTQVLARILGSHAIITSKADHATGRFTAHLAAALLLGAEEAFFAANRADDGKLKDLVTSEVLQIERKGIDSEKQPSYLRIIMTSNERWVVPSGPESRRWFVLDVMDPPPPGPKRVKYFKPIFDQLDNGGIEAFAHFLLERDISNADVRNVPETEALLEQRRLSTQGVDAFLVDVANDGFVSDPHSEKNYSIDSKSIPVAVIRAASQRRENLHDRNRTQDPRLGRALSDCGVSKTRTRSSGIREQVYVFPPLQEFRERVSERVGYPVGAKDHQAFLDWLKGHLPEGRRIERAALRGDAEEAGYVWDDVLPIVGDVLAGSARKKDGTKLYHWRGGKHPGTA